MVFVRLWVLILVASAVSWLVLRVLNRPQPFFHLLLFWMMAIFGSMGLMYGVSVWFTANQGA